jgi:hypothetical protein
MRSARLCCVLGWSTRRAGATADDELPAEAARQPTLDYLTHQHLVRHSLPLHHCSIHTRHSILAQKLAVTCTQAGTAEFHPCHLQEALRLNSSCEITAIAATRTRVTASLSPSLPTFALSRGYFLHPHPEQAFCKKPSASQFNITTLQHSTPLISLNILPHHGRL